MKELQELYNKYQKDVKELDTKEVKIYNQVKKLKKDFNKIKEHATVLQIFLASPNIEKIILKTEELVQRLEPRVFVQKIDSHLLHLSDWEQKLGKFDLIDKICISISPCPYVKTDMRRAQILSEPPNGTNSVSMLHRTITNTKLNLTDTMLFHGYNECRVTGCCIKPSGEYVFCDFSDNKRILIFCNGQTFKKCIRTMDKPHSVASISKEKIAVTFPEANMVKMLDSDIGYNLFETKLDGTPTGIASVKDSLFVRCSGAIFKLNLTGCILNELSVFEAFSSPIVALGKTLITSSENVIHWLRTDGKELRQCEISGLDEIHGLAVDISGNIYACGHKSDNIAVISQNGNEIKVFLDSEDGLNFPTGVAYDTKRNELLLVISNKSANDYDVTRKH